MSRVGKKPIPLPPGVTVTQEGSHITVSGSKGTLERSIRPEMRLEISDGVVTVFPTTQNRKISAYHGLTRALIAGMVDGVSRGFEKRLEIEGIGYRASLDGEALQFLLGFSHPVRFDPPQGIAFRVEKNVVTISGINKELVGTVAAEIRGLKPPEPYKGKGIHYVGEVIRRKAGKKATATAS